MHNICTAQTIDSKIRHQQSLLATSQIFVQLVNLSEEIISTKSEDNQP